jgi:tetratricopeptide (TPR) repeat protein
MQWETEDLSPELEEPEAAGEVEMLSDPEGSPPAAGVPTGEEELAFGGGMEEVPLDLEEGEVLLSESDMEEEAEPELLTVEEEKDDVFTVLEKEREGEDDFGGEIESIVEIEAVSGAAEAPTPPAEEVPAPPVEEIPGLSEEDEPSAVWADEALTRDASPEEGEPAAAALDAPPAPPAAGAAFTPEEGEAAPGSDAFPEAPAEGTPFEKVSVLLAALVPGDVLGIEGEEAGLPGWAAALADEASADLQGREGERPPPEGGEYLRLGILEYLLGRSDGAIDRLKKALRLTSDLGSVLNALAVATYARGRIDPPISYCREGLREAGGDPVLEIALWRNLGFLYQAKGDLAPAAEAYVSALDRMDPDADTLLRARLHTRAGQITRRLGDPRRGEQHLSEAVNLYRKGGDGESRIRALVALSSVQSELESFGPSLKSLDEAAALCASTGDKPGEALVLGQMGIAYAAQDQHTRALSHYEKALAAHRELGNRKGEAAMLSNIGNIHYFRDDLDEAFSAYEGALGINREEEHPIGIATSLGNLGRLNLEKGDMALAREQLSEARDLFKEAGAHAQLETVRSALEDLDQTGGAPPPAS